MTAVLDRTAPTDHPVVLDGRWSPRAFDPITPIDEDALSSALEAARWSPSANNVQPWRFIVARRGSELHRQLFGTLAGFNTAWAGSAAALIVAVAETADAEGQPIHFAAYDLGQAVAHFTVQAHHDGLHVHQMGGFDRAAVSEIAGLEARFVPTTMIAVGLVGDPSSLPGPLAEREVAPRERRPLSETVLLND